MTTARLIRLRPCAAARVLPRPGAADPHLVRLQIGIAIIVEAIPSALSALSVPADVVAWGVMIAGAAACREATGP